MSQSTTTSTVRRVRRRVFLRASALGTAALGLLACAPQSPAQPAPKAETKPAESKPAEAAKPAAPTQAPAAAKPAEAPKPAEAAKPPADSKPAAPAAAKPAETPRRGGELVFAVSAEPDTFDGHKSTTFANIHPVAPHYNTLVKFDPDGYPKIIGDLAESWTLAPDGLSYTFKLRDGVKFHDGSPFSSKDVKATYDRIINPPQGVVSARKQGFAAFAAVEAPDPRTIVFRLKYPSPGALQMLCTPYSYIYSAAALEKDQSFPDKNILGTGPYKFVEYVPGSHWVGKRNEEYWDQGKPYLDGYRALFIRDTAAQVAAVRGERAHAEFRGFTPQARDELVQALGDKITVKESSWFGLIFATFNTQKAPFDDARVRRALTLAIDRWEGGKVLSAISLPKYPGTLVRPDGPFAMPEAEMVKLAGFSKDGGASKEQAKALLKEAGVPDGFSFVYKNRDVPSPYEPIGVFLIDQWRKIGLNVTQQVLETTSYFNDIRAGNFEVVVDFAADFMDEPDLELAKFLSADRSATNYGKYTDRTLDDIYDKQAREQDPEKRKQLIWEFEKRVLDEQAYVALTPWWQRIVPHSSKLKGWEILPSHYLNQDLADVWLSE